MGESHKEKEIVKLFRAVKKAADEAAVGNFTNAEKEIRCLDLLKQLKEFQVNYQILFSTQVGKKLVTLKKHPNERIRVSSSELIDTWKNIIAKEIEGAGKDENGEDNKAPENGEVEVAKSQNIDIVPVKKRSMAEYIQAEGDATTGEISVKKVKVEIEQTKEKSSGCSLAPRKLHSLVKCHDDLRDKIRQRLFEALSKVSREVTDEYKDRVENSDPFRVAMNVESALFEKWGRTNGCQRPKYRSVMFNINDSKNPDFRRKVLLGYIPAETIPILATEDMASDERRSKNNEIKKKLLLECEREAAPKSTTDQFTCGRCGQRKTTYYQMQTRSADEPMTTYVTCVNCNNHWKFC